MPDPVETDPPKWPYTHPDLLVLAVDLRAGNWPEVAEDLERIFARIRGPLDVESWTLLIRALIVRVETAVLVAKTPA